MDYSSHYSRLIARARDRDLSVPTERHHVIPRCVGGSDDQTNIVALTPEEHYVAHQLLVKMHPANHKLIHAAVWMSKRCSGSRSYGWLRRRNAEAVRGRSHILFQGANNPFFGKQHSKETMAKLAIAAKNRGPLWRSRISKAAIGRKATTEARKKMSIARKGKCGGEGNGFYGKKHSPETLRKISASGLGRKNSQATKAKMSEAQKKRFATGKAGFAGKQHSDETKAKMRASRLAWLKDNGDPRRIEDLAKYGGRML